MVNALRTTLDHFIPPSHSKDIYDTVFFLIFIFFSLFYTIDFINPWSPATITGSSEDPTC